MPIIYGESKPNMMKPGKIFVHSVGLERYGSIKNAIAYADSFFGNNVSELTEEEYLLTIVWADNKANYIDIFGFSDVINHWPGNPDVKSWVLRNSVLIRDNPITCGDGLILLGGEEKLRRDCKSLDEYIKMISRFD